MNNSVFIIVAMVILLFIGVVYWFWYGNYYKNLKFMTLLTVLTTLTSIIFVSAAFFQVVSYYTTKANEEIDHYNALSKAFLDDTLELFIDHPEMNYYYQDLMGKKLIDKNTKRNYSLEHQISMLIFSRLAKFAIFAQQTHDKTISDKIQNWLGHVFNTFIQSPTLQSYWIHEYKPKLSGPASRLYMEEHYNL